MKKLIPFNTAVKVTMALLASLVFIHLLVIVGLIPSSAVWGGQIAEEAILPLELISIVITISMMLVVQIKVKYKKLGQKSIVGNVFLWIIAAFFLYNTFMNFISEASLENWVFGPLAFLLFLFTTRVALE